MLRRTVIALVVAFFCSAVVLPSQAEAAGKIGVANPMRLSAQSDPGKEAEKQLTSMFGKERQQLEKQNEDLSKQAEDLRKQAAALSEKARIERAQKIQKMAQELETKGTAYTQRLSRVQQAINSQMNEVMRTACENYAKKNGYLHPKYFVDDGISGTTFERPGFREMEALIEAGKVSTVIVKDLSRFGREHVETSRYLEIIYPSLGVKSVAIQERVDTETGEGTEMMPFHNIFNEWYAAQTSKKVRAVWAMKAANGKRSNFRVPYGYKRDELDKEKWLVDDAAAEVVQRIYHLCLEGIRCANYKSGRGECTIHYIRNVALEQIVSVAVSDLADFVTCHESFFLQMIGTQQSAGKDQNIRSVKSDIVAGKHRIDEIDRLIVKLYEDNFAGKLSDERYSRMAAKYEKEQAELLQSVSTKEKELAELERESVDIRLLLAGLREYSSMETLTLEVINKIIKRIEVHNSETVNGHKRVGVDIYFTGVGLVDLATIKEMLAIAESSRP